MSDSGNEDEPWQWHYKLIRQLYEKANQNEEEISKRNKALEQATATFCAQLDRLPAVLAASVERKLHTSFADAERKLEAAATIAGDRIVSRFTEANLDAERATAAYERGTKVSMRRIPGLAFACFLAGVAGVVLMMWFILPDEEKLSTMRREEARLTENIRNLIQRGGQAEVIGCTVGTTTRPCIRTDESLANGAFSRNNETFRLIYGQ
jgi:hypothetical protein